MSGGEGLHVVHVVDTDEFGGAEQAVANLLPGLVGAGVRVTLLHRATPQVQPLLDRVAAASPDVEMVPYDRSGFASVGRLARTIRALRADLLHVHLPTPLAGRTAVIAGRLARVPRIVATLQLVTDVPGGMRGRAKRTASRLVDHFIAVSGAVEHEARLVLPPAVRVSVVPNAVDLPAVTPPPGRREVLSLARLDEQKGVTHLVAAAAELPDATFRVAGTGPLRQSLQDEIDGRGIADRFHLLGYRDDALRLVEAADVFVLPSLNEGLPLSILEAMAAARPVVATAVGGTPEAVVDGETGLLVQPGDPAGLAAAIRRILDDPALAARMGAAGRARVEARFSSAAMAEGVLAVYREVAA